MTRGRPKLPEEKRRTQIGVRTSPKLKVMLEEAARINARSVAQEAEWRLERSFIDADLNERVLRLEKQMRGVIVQK